MMKRSTVLVAISLATLLTAFVPLPVARADIFQWEYINPANPAVGKQPSTMLCPGGAGAIAAPGANLSNRNLTKAYLVGADLSAYVAYDPEWGTIYSSSNLTGANLSQADLTYASLQNASVSGAILTGAEVRRANLDNTGIAPAQLYSTASYVAQDLTRIRLGYVNLAGANLASQNLTGAAFFGASLTGANLSGAEVRGTDFSRVYQSGTLSGGIAPAQLYSTASYQSHDLSGIWLGANELAGANLAGQNLTGASFSGISLGDPEGGGYTIPANLTGANLSGADARGTNFYGAALAGANLSHANLTNANFSGDFVYNAYTNLAGANLSGADSRGANFYLATLINANLSGADVRGANFEDATLTGAITSNLIQSNGHIAGLDLSASPSLVVRDYDGNPAVAPIVVDQHLAIDAGGTLRLVFDADAWDSTISFASGIPVTRSGTLELAFATDVNLAGQIGRTIDLFDWTGVSPTGAFTVSSPYIWNLSKLYTTGEVTLTAVPGLLPGDFNGSGTVDATDYVVWRKTDGTQAGYHTWRTNFVEQASTGSAAIANATIPEPATLVLLMIVVSGWCLQRD